MKKLLAKNASNHFIIRFLICFLIDLYRRMDTLASIVKVELLFVYM